MGQGRGERRPPRPPPGNRRGGRPHERDKPRSAPGGQREPRYDHVHLDDAVTRELRSLARPGKGDVLVKLFADAVSAYAAGDLEEAARLGDQAKHIALRSPAVREFLGLALYGLGRWNDAARELAAFRRLAGAHDQDPVLADCYRALGRPEKALSYVDEVQRAEVPEATYYEAQIVGAGALADAGDLDAAMERLKRLDLQPAVAQEHHVRAWYALADLLERRGRFTQARELFEAVAAIDEELTDASARAEKLRA